MTIPELKDAMHKLHRKSVICFSKIPIKLPDTIGFDRKRITIAKLEQKSDIVKNGYLITGTQCYTTDDPSLEVNEVEISFGFCTYCNIKSDEDILDLWDFHKAELEDLDE